MRIIIIPLFVFLIVIYSCKSSREVSNKSIDRDKISLHEGNWYVNFKNEVFFRCLKKLYPQSFSLMVDSLDASNTANIDQLDYNKQILMVADSLANNFIKRSEALWTIEGRKVILNVCISYRNSTELDSAAVFFHNRYNPQK